MMDRVTFDTTINEDLYSGYNDYSTAFNIKDLEQDVYLQEALKTSYGSRSGVYTGRKTPGTAMRLGTASGWREGTGARPVTASRGSNRPMTAVTGAGYSSQWASVFDPLNQASKPTSPFHKSDRLEERIKRLEESVMGLIDECCRASAKKEFSLGLERAKEASSKEKALIRLHEEAGQPDQHNIDLTYLVLLNMAVQYEANGMYSEALNTYNIMTRNRMFPNSNQLKVNMANVYASLGQLSRAIKLYRMTLDQVPNTHKDLRVKITHNIGLLFVRMGQYHDACNSFEYIMQEKPNFNAGLHTVLCYYAIGDKEKMKQSFKKMLEVPLDIDDDKYNPTEDDPQYNLVLEVIRNDKLRHWEKEKRRQAEHAVMTAAALISPVIDATFTAGYNWCIEAVGESGHEKIAGDLEVNKGIMYLKQRDVSLAIDTFRSLEKREPRLVATASNNLSFIHFLLGELDEAERLGEQAREADVYSPSAYVNLGNCFYSRGDVDKARSFYEIALANDPSSIEALYNLGCLDKREGHYGEAVRYLLKVQALVNNHPPVLYQLAHTHQLLGDIDQAIEWFLQLLTVEAVDPSVFLKLGEIYDSDNDKQQAFHYHYEAYRYLPSKVSVLDWLGSYYVRHRVAEKAVPFYKRAALMQPLEPKWPLLVGSCMRRAGDYQQALQTYKETHKKFPNNIDCLKLLVRLCNDLGMREASEYALELKRAEKAKQVRERISSSRATNSRPTTTTESSRKSSGGSWKAVGTASSPEHLATGHLPHTPYPGLSDGWSDPLEGDVERPRTGAPPPTAGHHDDFGEDSIVDSLLPE